MKLKMNGDIAVLQDGRPVYVADDGKEIAFDYAATLGTISRLNGEAKGHRERAEAAEARARLFDGIDDAEAARKALGIVKSLDEKRLLDAGQVDQIKAEAIKAVEDKWKPVAKERDTLKAALHAEKIGGSFARSRFIADKLAIPADIAEAAFGRAFDLEDGRIVAKDPTGNRIFSRARPGELADFDEALETLVAAYPNRDAILKGTGASGGGASGSGGTGGGGKRTITRAQFDALGPMEKAEAARTAAIVD